MAEMTEHTIIILYEYGTILTCIIPMHTSLYMLMIMPIYAIITCSRRKGEKKNYVYNKIPSYTRGVQNVKQIKM